jgi:integrase
VACHTGRQPTIADPQINGQPVFKWVAECLYRHSMSSRYYALVKRSGGQYRKSLRTTDRQLAERRLAGFRIKIGRNGNSSRDLGTTFMELAKDWCDVAKTRLKPSSARGVAGSIQQLNKHFGLLAVGNIASVHCHEWEKLRGVKISPSTFNHDRTTLIAVLNYAVKEGLLLENPALTIARRKLPKNKIVIPSKEDFCRLVATIRSLSPRAQKGADLVELLAYSGMRLAEATELTWGDVDFERGQFTVTGGAKGTKNHEVRTVPLFPALRSLLERIKAEREGGIAPTQRMVPIFTAKTAIKTACQKAKLAHFHHHLCHHFFVSQAIEAGVDFKTIAAWVGHKDGGVLVAKTYEHLRDEHSTEMAKRMTFSAS